MDERDRRIAPRDSVIRVAMVDSRPIIRRGLGQACLEDARLKLMLEAANAKDFLAKLRDTSVGVAIIQFELKDAPLSSLLASLERNGQRMRIATILDPEDDKSICMARELQIEAVVSTHEKINDILDAVAVAAAGHRFESQEFDEADRDSLPKFYTKAASQRPLLTVRELEVLEKVAKGATIYETGQSLNISTATVKNHRHSIYSKLGVDNAPAAIYRAFRSGMLSTRQ